MADPPATVRRLLLTLCGEETPPTLQTAALLAESLQAAIEAVFVEDLDLLNLAALPFAREIALASAAARPLQAVRIARLLQARAEHLQRLLARSAQERRLEWSFRVVRGRRVQTPVQIPADLYLFGAASAAPATASPVAPLLVAFEESPEALHALEVAAMLARYQERPLAVILAGEEFALRQTLFTHLPAVLRHSEVVVLPAAEGRALAYLARKRRAALLIMGRSPRWLAQLEPLLTLSPCPILLAP